MKRNSSTLALIAASALLGSSLAHAQTKDPCGARQIDLPSSNHSIVTHIVEWDPDADGPQRPLLVYGAPASEGYVPDYLVAWDGVNDVSLGDAVWGSVTAIGVWNGVLVVSGWMTLPGQPQVDTIATFDGATWHAIGNPSPQDWTNGLLDFRGDFVATGWFADADGNFVSGVMRFDGSNWEPLGGGTNGDVVWACMLGDELVVSGSLTSAGGVETGGLAAWNGKAWRPVADPSTPYTLALAALDNTLYAAVREDEVSWSVRRWDGTAWTDVRLPEEIMWYSLTQMLAVNGELYVAANYWCQGGGGGGFPGVPPCFPPPPVLLRWTDAGWEWQDTPWTVGWYTALGAYGPELVVGRRGERRYGWALSSVGRVLPSGVPWFVDQPRDATLELGTTVRFTAATVTGYDTDGAVSFQWQRNGEPIVDGPGGASAGGGTVSNASGVFDISFSTTLTIANAGASDAGEYRCVMTNSCGTVESAFARLASVTKCRADFNADATVNSTDVSDFINQWFLDQIEATLITDWDGNGVVNSTDVSNSSTPGSTTPPRGAGNRFGYLPLSTCSYVCELLPPPSHRARSMSISQLLFNRHRGSAARPLSGGCSR